MKKFSALLICLLMVITCGLAGCASFSINKVKYYNEVLATVDETKITRFDLLSAYNSYGNTYYVQQMGQSESKALANTLDLLIERESLYQYALDNDTIYRPTAYQVNEVVQEIFDSMDEQMETYVERAKRILNIEIEEDEETEEDTDDSKVYKREDYTYTKRATLDYKIKERTLYFEDAGLTTPTDEITQYTKTEKYREYFIVYETPEQEDKDNLIDENLLINFTSSATLEAIETAYFAHLLDELTLEERENAQLILNKAKSLFAKNLIDYEYYLRDENGNPYDRVTENLFDRYFKRTFESQIQSKYLDNIRIHYLENEELSIELLKEEYQYLTTRDYNKYDKNHTAYKNKMKDIGTDGNDVLYHPTTDTKFGYFIHTLISFDSIKENLKNIETLDGSLKEQAYKDAVWSIKLQERDLTSGKVKEGTKKESLNEVLTKYQELRTATYSDNKSKLNAFVEFMFKYTGDTATLSQGMPYVIGYNPNEYTGAVDKDNKLIGTTSAMVNEFTKEAIALMKNNATSGNMSTEDLFDLNNMCITEYGIHLLYYVGDVNSYDIPFEDLGKVYIETENKNDTDMYNLYRKVINPLSGKTYFDMMFDIVYPASSDEVYTSNTGYTDYEKELTELSQTTHKVTKYTTKIKATKTNI